MRKYLLHVLIISFVFFLTPTVPVASYTGEIETYKQEVEKNPDDALAHYNLGVGYGESGMYEEAIESFKQAIRIDPDDAVVHYSLGLAYHYSSDSDSALEQYKILKSLDPSLANKLVDIIYKQFKGRKLNQMANPTKPPEFNVSVGLYYAYTAVFHIIQLGEYV